MNHGYKLVGRSRIRTLAFKAESRTRIDHLQAKVSRMKSYFEQPTWKRVEVEMKRKIETDQYLEEIREMKYWRLLEKASKRVTNMGYEMDMLMRANIGVLKTHRGWEPT